MSESSPRQVRGAAPPDRRAARRTPRSILFGVTDGVSVRPLLQGQLSWLSARGWDVTVVCNDSAGVGELCHDEGARHLPLTMSRNPAPLADVRSLLRLVRVVRAVRPDVCVFGTPKAGLLGTLAARAACVPSLYWLYGLRLEGSRGLPRLVLWLSERMTTMLASQVLAVGLDLREKAETLGVVGRGRARVPLNGSANGVPVAEAAHPTVTDRSSSADDPTVAFVGRITRDKGIQELTDAWEAVVRRHPRARLLVAGRVESVTDRDADELAQALARLPGVEMCGHVEDVSLVYRRAHLLVLPSYREGLPTVVLEAAAHGVPAVVTDCTGGPESVAYGRVGVVVPKRDALALARAVGDLLDDPVELRRLGVGAQQWVRSAFDQVALWTAIEDEAERLLPSRARP